MLNNAQVFLKLNFINDWFKLKEKVNLILNSKQDKSIQCYDNELYDFNSKLIMKPNIFVLIALNLIIVTLMMFQLT